MCVQDTHFVHAAHKREREKIEKYKELTSFIFVPIGLETSGVWGPNALKFIGEVGNKLKTITGQPLSTAYLTQRISLAVQRGNASSILGAISQPKGLEEIFYILHPTKRDSTLNPGLLGALAYKAHSCIRRTFSSAHVSNSYKMHVYVHPCIRRTVSAASKKQRIRRA